MGGDKGARVPKALVHAGLLGCRALAEGLKQHPLDAHNTAQVVDILVASGLRDAGCVGCWIPAAARTTKALGDS